jgi:hypothetical protein
VALIDEAIDRILADPAAYSLRSVTWPVQTPYKMWRIGAAGYLESLLAVDGLVESHSLPRQMLPEVFWQNGYVDVIRARTIERGSMTGTRILPFVVDEPNYEIDYPDSVPVVEAALLEQASARGTAAPGRPAGRRHPV